PSRAVEVRVQQLYNHSVFAASDSPNIAYKYLNIISSLTAPKEISDIKIKFKVANGWIASNGIKTSDVVMYRWHDDKWNPLLTEITGSDTAYVYYTSNSPGFSPFCISTVLRGDMTDIVSAGVDEDMSHTSSPSKIQSDRIFETNESASGNRLSKLSGFGIIILIGLLAGIAYMLWGMRLKQGGGKNT
ncbi:MAG: PGF-pre-PGF domain-containing protein, partial [Methanosarcinales archaeon]|nr:PGF-pre-PGF domain-containing protein [Methanosarcinales archaeon]